MPSEDTNVYARFAHGFKAGGFDSTISASSDPGDLSFDAEFINSYELGIKTYLANRRVRLNAAVFTLDWTDKQEQFFNGINFLTSNAASADNTGVEFELVALLTPGLELTASAGYQDAKYNKFVDPLIGADFSGNDLAGIPDWTGFLALDYNRSFGGGWNWMLHGDVVYRGDSFGDAANDPANVLESHTLLNGRIGITSPSGRYGIAAWGRNLTEEDYLLGGFRFLGTDNISINAPRTYGVEFRVNL